MLKTRRPPSLLAGAFVLNCQSPMARADSTPPSSDGGVGLLQGPGEMLQACGPNDSVGVGMSIRDVIFDPAMER